MAAFFILSLFAFLNFWFFDFSVWLLVFSHKTEIQTTRQHKKEGKSLPDTHTHTHQPTNQQVEIPPSQLHQCPRNLHTKSKRLPESIWWGPSLCLCPCPLSLLSLLSLPILSCAVPPPAVPTICGPRNRLLVVVTAAAGIRLQRACTVGGRIILNEHIRLNNSNPWLEIKISMRQLNGLRFSF